ncbi:MAG: GIY-YIG nuclease family protein [Bacteroidales bacterium]|nr:GIY-YIG nuclease family protein [Bacteroidales bacterium]
MYYIYFLYSENHDKYYVGYSDDPDRRVLEHNTNPRMTFTHKFRPWILKTYFPVSDIRGDTLKVERFIKRQKSRRLITNLIDQPEGFKDIIKKVLK